MILETYQEQQTIVREDPPGQSFAVVGTVHEDGISLIFNGSTDESLKHYKCNSTVHFQSGQKVRIIEESGTYVVEYPVGNPAESINADYAARAGYAEKAGTAGTAARSDSSTNAVKAENAVLAQQVENQAEGIANLLFSYDAQGELYVRAVTDSNWTKLTGTVVSLE